jgi:hypothetical protein
MPAYSLDGEELSDTHGLGLFVGLRSREDVAHGESCGGGKAADMGRDGQVLVGRVLGDDEDEDDDEGRDRGRGTSGVMSMGVGTSSTSREARPREDTTACPSGVVYISSLSLSLTLSRAQRLSGDPDSSVYHHD